MSWNDKENVTFICRSANRDGDFPGYRYGHLGFRIAKKATLQDIQDKLNRLKPDLDVWWQEIDRDSLTS